MYPPPVPDVDWEEFEEALRRFKPPEGMEEELEKHRDALRDEDD